MKKSELKQIIREEIQRVLGEGFQGDESDDKIWRKNEEDILKYGLEGARDWKKGIDINYGPYKDQDSFEYMYWKKGWEDADLAAAKRKTNKS
jgi:hypothetical protein